METNSHTRKLHSVASIRVLLETHAHFPNSGISNTYQSTAYLIDKCWSSRFKTAYRSSRTEKDNCIQVSLLTREQNIFIRKQLFFLEIIWVDKTSDIWVWSNIHNNSKIYWDISLQLVMSSCMNYMWQTILRYHLYSAGHSSRQQK